MVVKRECDLPMARSKNLLPCDRECKECMACIETTDTGERRHCTRLRDREIGPRIPPQNNKVRHEFEPARDCRKWSEVEDSRLIFLRRQGLSFARIAERMRRPVSSVGDRYRKITQER